MDAAGAERPWVVHVEAQAGRALDLLEDAAWHEARGVIEDLREDPFLPDAIPLRGWRKIYRVPFYGGRYRMIYRVNERRRRVVIYRISARADVYRGFQRW